VTAPLYIARYTFDLASNRWKLVKDTGNADPEAFVAEEVTKYKYDQNDRLEWERFDHASNNALDATTFYEYDLTEEIARQGTFKALGVSRGMLDGVTVIGDNFFFRYTPR